MSLSPSSLFSFSLVSVVGGRGGRGSLFTSDRRLKVARDCMGEEGAGEEEGEGEGKLCGVKGGGGGRERGRP